MIQQHFRRQFCPSRLFATFDWLLSLQIVSDNTIKQKKLGRWKWALGLVHGTTIRLVKSYSEQTRNVKITTRQYFLKNAHIYQLLNNHSRQNRCLLPPIKPSIWFCYLFYFRSIQMNSRSTIYLMHNNLLV